MNALTLADTAIASTALLIGCYELFIYARQRRLEHLAVALVAVSAAAFAATNGVHAAVGTAASAPQLTRLKFVFANFAFHLLAAWAALTTGTPPRRLIPWGLVAVALTALLLGTDWIIQDAITFQEFWLLGRPYPQPVVTVPQGAFYIYGFGVTLWTVIRLLRGGRDHALGWVIAGLIVWFVTALHDVFLSFTSFPTIGYLMEWGFLAFALSLSALHAQRYADLLRRSQEDRQMAFLERDAAFESSMQAEQLNRAVVENVQQGIALLGPAGRVKLWNPFMERFTGVSATEAALEPFLEVFPVVEDQREQLRRDLARRADGVTVNGEDIALTSRRFAACTFHPYVHSATGKAGTIVLVRDVTERRRVQARLVEMDRMISVGTMAAGVGHEVNNPLAFLRMNVEYALESIRKGFADPGELKVVLEDAQEGADRIAGVVSQLKSMATQTHAKPFEPVPLQRVLGWALRTADHEIRHRATLVTELGEVPPVMGDEARLGQVFLNLLLNAAQALPVGSALDHRITVRCRRDGDAAVVEVEDTGPGIPDDALPRIFEPFYTTKASAEGTGLGLSISRQIAEEHGGSIEALKPDGGGSCLRVTLPATLHPTSRPPKPRTVSDPPPRAERVVIVDDEPMVLRSMKRILKSDHDVVTTTSARDLLTRLEAGERFGVIFCDLMMPEMTGMELQRTLEQRFPDAASRTIFITGGAFTDEARDFVEVMGDRCLSKPVEARVVRDLVRIMASPRTRPSTLH